MIKNKSNAFENFKNFIIEAMNQFKTNIKIIRTDNGSEFTSHDFQNFLKQHGIKQ